jgi:hypothetical protein
MSDFGGRRGQEDEQKPDFLEKRGFYLGRAGGSAGGDAACGAGAGLSHHNAQFSCAVKVC